MSVVFDNRYAIGFVSCTLSHVRVIFFVPSFLLGRNMSCVLAITDHSFLCTVLFNIYLCPLLGLRCVGQGRSSGCIAGRTVEHIGGLTQAVLLPPCSSARNTKPLHLHTESRTRHGGSSSCAFCLRVSHVDGKREHVVFVVGARIGTLLRRRRAAAT